MRLVRSITLLVTFLVSLLVAALLVELAARLVLPPPRYHQTPLEIDAELGFRAIPLHRSRFISPFDAARGHDILLDGDGFRGRALPAEPLAEEAERIVFLGDSFLVAEAVPLESMLTQRVEAALVSAGRPAEVYNLSTVDYGTGQQILLLDRFAPQIEPAVVVLALYPSNDVANNAFVLAGRTRVSPGDAIRPYLQVGEEGRLETTWVNPLRAFARRYSWVYATVERGFFPPQVGSGSRRSIGERLASGEPPREFLEVFRAHPPDHPWEQAWRETESLILALRDRCARLGARLHVVVLPSEPQVVVTPQSLAFEIESAAAGHSLDEMIDWNSPERRLAGFFSREGIEWTPLLERLRRAASEGIPVFTRDRHLNERGHAIAARAIVEALLEGPVEAPPRGDRSRRPGRSGEGDTGRSLGRPADWPNREGWTGLDLRRASQSERFSDGWLTWQPASESYPGGWRIGRRGLIALRAVPGDLMLRGFAVAPLVLELGFAGGGPSETHRVERSGMFELRMQLGARPRRSATGHSVLIVDVGDAIGGLIVQQVGFRPKSRARVEPTGPALLSRDSEFRRSGSRRIAARATRKRSVQAGAVVAGPRESDSITSSIKGPSFSATAASDRSR